MTRYIAHIIFEAKTPLKMGSNENDFLHDSLVQKDWNSLPMLLGTSLAGVLRKEFRGDAKLLFGEETGSRVIISNALLLDENEKVHENLLLEKNSFLKIFDQLPIREHTAINDKGVAKKGSKFDEEVVYKGTRFKFSIEVLDDKKGFEEILKKLYLKPFRVGGGSTKGFGSISVLNIEYKSYDEEAYVDYSSSLNYKLNGKKYIPEDVETDTHLQYILKIKPDDFFLFGSGFGDSDADMTPVYEEVIDYEKKCLSKKQILIPASSIKGALSHKTTFHYNKIHEYNVENGKGVLSVSEIFGEAKDSKNEQHSSKGKVLMSDCFMNNDAKTKVFDHVSIDRFTGGAIDGALFQEKTLHDKRVYTIEIFVEKDVDSNALKAFELALQDITTGMLPLGGMTTKGHGFFSGTLFKNGEKYEVAN